MDNASFTDIVWATDRLRRQQGEALERLGFGPVTTPSRTIATFRSGHLVGYGKPARGRPALLLVPAPIKTAYIFDLAPGSSVVERCIDAGLQTYLIVWRRPQPVDESMGFDEYADRALAKCVDAIERETASKRVFVVGHSLGGTLAAIFSSLAPDRVAGLIALEAPIEFGAGVLEAAIRSAPSAASITAAFGNVPGSFLTFASVNADPLTFNVEPAWDALAGSRSAASTRLHWRVRRWSLDESPMAARLFEQTVDELYRDNRFAERRLRVGGAAADPMAIDMPVLAVVDPRSRIVPRASVDAYRTRTGSCDVQILHYRGDQGVMVQHVGVLVGANAHRALWPRILRWIHRRA
jgi:polyhydroxyalkanoate synthase